MAQGSFSAQVSAWAAQTRERMDAIRKESAQRVIEVASAAPLAPKAGRPKLPSTSGQASRKLTILPVSMITVPGQGRLIPSKKKLQAANNMRPGMPAAK